VSEVTRAEERFAVLEGRDGQNEVDVYESVIPDGKGTVLEGSPHRYFVHSLFISGWHPIAIARALKREEGVDLDPAEIGEYCLSISPADVRPGALARFFKNRNFITDPLADMHKLILLQQERVMRLIKLEDMAYEEDPKKAVNTKLTHQLALLQRWQKELALTEHRLGVNRTAPMGDNVASKIARPKTLQDLVEDAKKITLTERTVSFERDSE